MSILINDPAKIIPTPDPYPVPTLSTAEAASEVIEATARFVWWADHKADCPDDAIPTVEEFCIWLGEAPQPSNEAAGPISETLLRMLLQVWQHSREPRGTPPLGTAICAWQNRPPRLKSRRGRMRGSCRSFAFRRTARNASAECCSKGCSITAHKTSSHSSRPRPFENLSRSWTLPTRPASR